MQNLVIDGWGMSCEITEITFNWMSLEFADDE